MIAGNFEKQTGDFGLLQTTRWFMGVPYREIYCCLVGGFVSYNGFVMSQYYSSL
jgi:hypothetical protein